MPNWCANHLVVRGDEKEITRFRKQAESGKVKDSDTMHDIEFTISPFLPMPKDLEGTRSPSLRPVKRLIKKYGTDNWYDWRVKNWGTKWDVEGYLEDESPRKLGYTFDSAWGPPDEAIKAMSKMYPTLTFTLKYDEPGMDFSGTLKLRNGEVLMNDQVESKIAKQLND